MKTILTLILIFVCSSALAEGYILPKSFKIKNTDLPPVEENIEPVVNVDKMPDVPAVTDVSLANLVKSFEYDYANTFKSTLNTLLLFDIVPSEYDSTRGQIKARLASGRELFILILPSDEKMTHIRITPADGRYDISLELVNNIFRAIDRSLYSGV